MAVASTKLTASGAAGWSGSLPRCWASARSITSAGPVPRLSTASPPAIFDTILWSVRKTSARQALSTA